MLLLSKVYEKVRRDLLATIDSEELKERLIGGGLPSKDCLRTSATTARCVPKAPDCHDDINLLDVPYKDGTADKFSICLGEVKDLEKIETCFSLGPQGQSSSLLPPASRVEMLHFPVPQSSFTR